MGECSATCGGGSRTIKSEVVQEAEHGGEKCPALEMIMVCNTEECPGSFLILLFDFIISSLLFSVDCKVDDWSAWGDCDVTCGRGTKTRSREVLQEAEHGGEKCPDLEITMVCNAEECPGPIFTLLFDFHHYMLLNVDLQLTAKLTIGQHGVIAM